MAEFFDRYEQFKDNGQVKNLPFIKIPEKSTDKRIVWKEGVSRMDKISQKFYGTPLLGWMILQKNSQYGGMEFDIPDGSIISVPFPIKQTIEEYSKAVDDYLKL